MVDLNINTYMTYRTPTILESGAINYVSFKPISMNSFQANKSATIKISSNTELFVPERSYLKCFCFNYKNRGINYIVLISKF